MRSSRGWHPENGIVGGSASWRKRREQMLLRLNEVYSNAMEPEEKLLLKGVKAKVRQTLRTVVSEGRQGQA